MSTNLTFGHMSNYPIKCFIGSNTKNNSENSGTGWCTWCTWHGVHGVHGHRKVVPVKV